MATISLKISLDGGKVVKTIQFEPSITVYDACRLIREKILEASAGDPKEYGLFLASDEDNKKGIWLEASRSLDYYMLRNGDLLEYNKKTRNLRVRMLDGTVKTMLVDDSQIVANLMVVICTKIGITNYDEYGLVREEQKEEADPCEKPNYGTLTLKRKHQEKERDAKMEQLRKKLRTDDEVNWVEPSKTLREQGVEWGETLLLRRKLFFSDRNVDSRDPVQLNLLYVQARDAILDGTHPVTQDKACEFAGIQCQIQFGDHREDKHLPGFLDLKEFLPASYMKVKGIEKKVFKEHRRHAGLSELDAKVLYTKSARELKTYGVAFFLVKEKMKGKNKLVPRLLGVTKNSVLRLDEKTKEILQTWPLTTVRRWCASPNTFTLDFGDYSDQYYSVQTTEAEQILQVIAGYIDIIVRKQRAKDHLGIEGDEGSAMLEDSVSPSKANIIQHDTYKSGKVNTESVAKPAVHRPGAEGAKPFAVGHVTGAQQTTVSGQIITGHAPPAASQVQQHRVTSLLSEPQRALLSTITAGCELIKHTEQTLTRASLPELGQDAASVKWKQVTMDSSKQVVTSQIAAMNAATARVVTLTNGGTEEVDHTAVGAAITTITSNLPEVTKGVQMIAALMDDADNGDRLLDATRRLCTAFTDLLKAAEPDTKEPRQNLLNAASRVGEASTSVLHTIGEETEEDKETQDILLSLAKSVANTTAALVLKAKNVAAQCKTDQLLQNNIIAAATHCALATSQLVACAKVVAPTIQNPACREQLISAARQVGAAVEKLVDACRTVPEPATPAVEHLTAAAGRVSEELERLLAHCQLDRAPHQTATQRVVESVMSCSTRVESARDAASMVAHARALGQATAHLITTIKTEAEQQPSEKQGRLLAAAKLLAEATARMVEAARQCASEPADAQRQHALRHAAEELRHIAAEYARHPHHDSVRHTQRLQECARQAASSATQLITAAHNTAQYSTNKYAQETLTAECRTLSEHLPRVVEASRNTLDTAASQLDLISASETFLQPSGHVVAAARAALPGVGDAAAARHLALTVHNYTDACTDLRTSVDRARIACKGLELDAAAEIIKSLQAELDELDEAARALEFTPLPGQTEEWASQTMRSASRAAAGSTAQLVSAVKASDPSAAGSAGCELAGSLRELSSAVRGAAANHPPSHRHRVIMSGKYVLHSSLTLVETVQQYFSTSEPVDTATIVSLAKEISQGLEQTMEAIPSHGELDNVLENINETLNILNMGEFPPPERAYGELQTELNDAAVEMSTAASNVVGRVESRPELNAASSHFGASFNRLLAAAIEMCSHTEEVESRTQMVTSMKSVTVNSSKLLGTAKSVSQDVTRPNAKNQLAGAARAVTEAINRLVDVCTEAGPGQKECEAAVRSISSARALLQAPAQPLNELGYFACLDAVVEHSKTLSEGMSGMASAVKQSAYEQFSRGVSLTAQAVQGLVECAAQAAYLVAVSDESSVAGRAGLVDQGQFARAALAIEQACAALADPASTQHQVLSAATLIAKHTSALCNACRAASARSASPHAKRAFVHAAKEVANCTAALVKEIKALDSNYTPENRARCGAATGPLQDAVRSLRQFADSPEFASVPARISTQARRTAQPILDAGRDIISGSCSMLESAKVLALAPQDRPHWQSLATHSKSVSDTIKSLVTHIREKAPGQRECAAAVEALSKQLRELDVAAIQAVSQELQPRKNNSLEGFCEQIENSASEMAERLEPLRVAATAEPENLGHAIKQLVLYSETLVSACVGAASLTTESSAQTEVLQHARTVLEAAAPLAAAAARCAAAPAAGQAGQAQGELEAGARATGAALGELAGCVRALAAARGAVGPLLDTVQRAISTLTDRRMSLIGSYDETDSFVDYQTRMVGAAKEISRLATDMTAKSATDASRLVALGNEMCVKYEQLAQDSIGASATTPNSDVANSIRIAVVELGEAVSSSIKAGGLCRVAASDANRRTVAERARDVNEKVIGVLSALQAGSRGTQACIDAAATIAAIIGDLDTTILFASAGTLQSEKESDTFSDHRENILKTAKTLVEDTKTLVGGAAGTQEQLASAAQNALTTIVQLCEVVKTGAMSLGASNPEPQVLLLNAARDVACALRDLSAATTAASGKHVAHPHMQRLKHAAKLLSDNTKRWSLPVKNNTIPRQAKRRSITLGLRNDYYSCDSETDLFQSDQEEELIKLLDYSSQDDDVSPSVFYDNCEDVIAYIESLMANPVKCIKNDGVNDRYNTTARNSLVDMDWRVLKYGENILLGEIKKLVDYTVDTFDSLDKRQKRDLLNKLRASSDLDKEMNRLSRVLEDMESEIETDEITVTTTVKTTTTTIPAKKPKLEEETLTSPVFRIKKVKPINLNIDRISPEKVIEILDKTDEKVKVPVTPKSPKNVPFTPKSPEAQKDEATEITLKPDMKSRECTPFSPNTMNRKVKIEFWKLFKDDTEWWKAIAKRNLDKMEETRRDLETFSGHELVLGEIQTNIEKYEKEKETLQTFIEEVDKSKAFNRDLEYDKKYEDMVLKLISFAKKDFIYKGFDPLIEQLKTLSNIKLGRKKKIVNIEDIVNIYTQINITEYTYEELCLLEKYYKEIIRRYKKENCDKENVSDINDRSQTPTYHKNVLINIHSSQNSNKNINRYSNIVVTNGDTIKRSQIRNEKQKNNLEIFDLTRTYPMEYYANNWWTIYQDVLKNREQQFGSLDQWWNFYEAILNKKDTSEEELKRIRAIVEFRNNIRKSRPNSRMEEQLKMLDEIRNDRFQETEAVSVSTDKNDSVMVTNVTSLLKTVKAVEDEHTRGTRALESTIEAISQEIEVLMSASLPKSTSSPEELVRCTRAMTVATARAVAAGNANKQDQLTAAANLGRKTVLDLLVSCKGAAHAAESSELQQRTLECGRAAAESYRALLQAVLAACGGDSTARQAFPDLSRRVAHTVADILATAELLKGSDWVDPDDPTVIAENELLGAAASIDAAARKLDSLRPRKTVQVQEADESLNFDEMILEAARAIIAATSALVRAASAAQRELIDQGKVARRPAQSSDDGQWSEGLVSAARLVAAAAHALVEAANALVHGAATEERLVSAARQVAASTAQLLVACKVKADPSSESTRRLQAAGGEVIRSTDNLVRAARDAMHCEEERSLVLNRRMVGGIAQEIDARSEVLRIEKELEEARGRLTAIRQAKYKLRGDTSGEETDTDGPQHDYQRVKSPTSSFVNTTYSPNSTYSPHPHPHPHPHPQQPHNATNLSSHASQLNQSVGASNQHYSHTQNYTQSSASAHNASNPPPSDRNGGYSQNSYRSEDKGYTVTSPTFSSFRPEHKQNYEGFTTRDTTNDRTMKNITSMTEETVTVKSIQLPEVRMAYLVEDPPEKISTYKRLVPGSAAALAPVARGGAPTPGAKPPPPPPRRVSLLKCEEPSAYETRLYDTPRPVNEFSKTERSETHHQYTKEHKLGYDAPKSPMSPKFNARELKFDDKEPIYSTLKKPSDGLGQTFSEHHKSTEAIPGGTKHSEFTVKSESYQSYPKTEFSKIETREEIKSPFTSTPKFDRTDFKATSTDLVKAVTPDYDRISSPYGKETHSYGGPNFMEETTTEVKEIPNGTQKITTTKIYSSSPVNLTTTNTSTKYEPIKLEGLDELSKSFDNDSKYSTLDSRFNTLESNISSDTSRSFMRPSEFQSSDYQSTNVIKVKKPADLVKELDSMDKKFSKSTITSETIEKKSIMTSSHKSETSSTVTKKFGNL